MIGRDTPLICVFKGHFQGHKGSKFQYISYVLNGAVTILLLRHLTRGQYLTTTGYISYELPTTK